MSVVQTWSWQGVLLLLEARICQNDMRCCFSCLLYTGYLNHIHLYNYIRSSVYPSINSILSSVFEDLRAFGDRTKIPGKSCMKTPKLEQLQVARGFFTPKGPKTSGYCKLYKWNKNTVKLYKWNQKNTREMVKQQHLSNIFLKHLRHKKKRSWKNQTDKCHTFESNTMRWQRGESLCSKR